MREESVWIVTSKTLSDNSPICSQCHGQIAWHSQVVTESYLLLGNAQEGEEGSTLFY